MDLLTTPRGITLPFGFVSLPCALRGLRTRCLCLPRTIAPQRTAFSWPRSLGDTWTWSYELATSAAVEGETRSRAVSFSNVGSRDNGKRIDQLPISKQLREIETNTG